MAIQQTVIEVVTEFKDGASAAVSGRASAGFDRYTASIEKMKRTLGGFNGNSASMGGFWNSFTQGASAAGSAAEGVFNKVKSFAGKAVSIPIGIVDKVTAPLRGIYNFATSIKGVLTGMFAGQAWNATVSSPLQLADSYSKASLGFEILFKSAEKAKSMMNDLDEFARTTPFNTTDVIANSQKMIAMGWQADNIISDMKTIGDAAAATGKGTEGLNRIMLALSQIKSKGKLSAEEMNQLAEAGISARRYLAEGLGYGTGDAGIAAFTEVQEKGGIGADEAISALMKGMEEYKGMMDKTARETVEGLKAQLSDTFEINIARKWGQGLQEGAKTGLGALVDMLDASQDKLAAVGEMLRQVGADVSNFAAGALKGTVDRVLELGQSADFKNADLFGKIDLAWDKLIAEPLDAWWNGPGGAKFKEIGGNIGKFIGEGILSGIGMVVQQFIPNLLKSLGNLVPGGEKAGAGDWANAGIAALALGKTGLGGVLGSLLSKGAGKLFGGLGGNGAIGSALMEAVPTVVSGLASVASTKGTGTALTSVGAGVMDSFFAKMAIEQESESKALLKQARSATRKGLFGDAASLKEQATGIMQNATENRQAAGANNVELLWNTWQQKQLLANKAQEKAAEASNKAAKLYEKAQAQSEGFDRQLTYEKWEKAAVKSEKAQANAARLTQDAGNALVQSKTEQAKLNKATKAASEAKLAEEEAAKTAQAQQGTTAVRAVSTLMKALGIGGAIVGGVGLISAGNDLVASTQKIDEKQADVLATTGWTKAGMVGSGAALGALIGSIIPGVGTLIGAGIGAGAGGLGALFAGDSVGQWISDKRDGTQEIKDITARLSESTGNYASVSERISETDALIGRWQELNDLMANADATPNAKVEAQREMADITERLCEIYPDLISQYEKENGIFESRVELLKQMNQLELKRASLSLQKSLIEWDTISPMINTNIEDSISQQGKYKAQLDVLNSEGENGQTIYGGLFALQPQAQAAQMHFDEYDPNATDAPEKLDELRNEVKSTIDAYNEWFDSASGKFKQAGIDLSELGIKKFDDYDPDNLEYSQIMDIIPELNEMFGENSTNGVTGKLSAYAEKIIEALGNEFDREAQYRDYVAEGYQGTRTELADSMGISAAYGESMDNVAKDYWNLDKSGMQSVQSFMDQLQVIQKSDKFKYLNESDKYDQGALAKIAASYAPDEARKQAGFEDVTVTGLNSAIRSELVAQNRENVRKIYDNASGYSDEELRTQLTDAGFKIDDSFSTAMDALTAAINAWFPELAQTISDEEKLTDDTFKEKYGDLTEEQLRNLTPEQATQLQNYLSGKGQDLDPNGTFKNGGIDGIIGDVSIGAINAIKAALGITEGSTGGEKEYFYDDKTPETEVEKPSQTPVTRPGGGISPEGSMYGVEEPAQKAPQYGDTGEGIQQLQKNLIDLGYDLGPSGADGIFGPATQAAVDAFNALKAKLGVGNEDGTDGSGASEGNTESTVKGERRGEAPEQKEPFTAGMGGDRRSQPLYHGERRGEAPEREEPLTAGVGGTRRSGGVYHGERRGEAPEQKEPVYGPIEIPQVGTYAGERRGEVPIQQTAEQMQIDAASAVINVGEAQGETGGESPTEPEFTYGNMPELGEEPGTAGSLNFGELESFDWKDALMGMFTDFPTTDELFGETGASEQPSEPLEGVDVGEQIAGALEGADVGGAASETLAEQIANAGIPDEINTALTDPLATAGSDITDAATQAATDIGTAGSDITDAATQAATDIGTAGDTAASSITTGGTTVGNACDGIGKAIGGGGVNVREKFSEAGESVSRGGSSLASSLSTYAVKIANIKIPTIRVPVVGWGGASSGTPVEARAEGGFVDGAQYSMVGEDGPEAIIPLGSKRRRRGLELWYEAGQRMGVPMFADGGIVGDDAEVPRVLAFVSGNDEPDAPASGNAPTSAASPAQTPSITQQNIFNITGSNAQEIAAQIRAMLDEISGEMAKQIVEIYANTPA